MSAAAPKVDVADTIGAGDTVMGAIAADIDRRLADAPHAAPADVVRAWGPGEWGPILERATRAAAITVSRPGANPPTAEELG